MMLLVVRQEGHLACKSSATTTNKILLWDQHSLECVLILRKLHFLAKMLGYRNEYIKNYLWNNLEYL